MKEEITKSEELLKDGKRHLKYGVGFGVLSLGAVAVFGALACPLCVVAVPGFIASGVIKMKQSKDVKKIKDQLA